MPDFVRVRFAPSPTGPLHIGGVRTALYNFLFAKKHEGTFILRMEDTDQKRLVQGAEQYILDALGWCGISFQEDIRQGGPYAPYRQSERKEIYSTYVRQLLDAGHAYYAFDTPDELLAIRSQVPAASREQFQYSARNRMSLKNSFSLPPAKVQSLLQEGEPYVVRLKIPEHEIISFQDLIRGEVHFHSENLDDKVIFKSDGFPTYHLANVVDDYLMKITHVIRGEEWLPSSPMHVLLYRFFNWMDKMPQFAHLPLILRPDGNGKLSKRDGDRLGFPVFPLSWKDPTTGETSHGYREDGYLPEAFINMLALLGWNPGTTQEILSMNELVSLFSIDRVHKSGSRFDPEKAKWFNHHYLSHMSDSRLTELLEAYVSNSIDGSFLPADKAYVCRVMSLIKDRATLIPDLWNNSRYFFYPPTSYDIQLKDKIWKSDTNFLLLTFLSAVKDLSVWNPTSFHDFVVTFTFRQQVKMGQLMNPLRLLVVGSNQGPGMAEIAALIGKEDFIRRIETGLERLTP